MSNTSIRNNETVVKEPVLEDNLNILRKIAWDFAKRYELDFDDLFQEACLACIQALPRYKPEKGAFSTFLWHTATNALKDLLNKNTNFDKRHIFTDDFSMCAATETAAASDEVIAAENFSELWAALSPEAQEICRMLFEPESLYLHTESGNFRRQVVLPTDKPRRCRKILQHNLEVRGWSKAKIQRAFREIRLALNT